MKPSFTAFGTILAGVLAFVAGCTHTPHSTTAQSPQDQFFGRVAALCGHAYPGRVVADEPAPAGADPFGGRTLVMHVRECNGDTIRMPFHVGDDRSRTWVLTRTASGLRLKHDHRHADGSADAVTMYGGDSTDAGTAQRQQFPADGHSQAMFTQQGRNVSNTNVWAMEIDPGQRFVYELARPGRLFRVEFDLRHPVPAPPAPWGASDQATPVTDTDTEFVTP